MGTVFVVTGPLGGIIRACATKQGAIEFIKQWSNHSGEALEHTDPNNEKLWLIYAGKGFGMHYKIYEVDYN